MFQVKRILDDKIFDIYETDITEVYDGHNRRLPNRILFLIFDETEWKWVESGYYEPYNNISSKIERLEKIKKAAEDITISFECYMAQNKPIAQWEEGEHIIFPRWHILLKALDGDK